MDISEPIALCAWYLNYYNSPARLKPPFKLHPWLTIDQERYFDILRTDALIILDRARNLASQQWAGEYAALRQMAALKDLVFAVDDDVDF